MPDAGVGVDSPPLRAAPLLRAGVDHRPRIGRRIYRCRGDGPDPRLGIGTTTNAGAGSPSSSVGERSRTNSHARGATSATIPSAQRSRSPANADARLRAVPVGDSAPTSFNRESNGRRPAASDDRSRTPDRGQHAFDELAGPTDFVSALAGRVVGLGVTSASATGGRRWRSCVAITRSSATRSPLFVLDGVPLENTPRRSGSGPGRRLRLRLSDSGHRAGRGCDGTGAARSGRGDLGRPGGERRHPDHDARRPRFVGIRGIGEPERIERVPAQASRISERVWSGAQRPVLLLRRPGRRDERRRRTELGPGASGSGAHAGEPDGSAAGDRPTARASGCPIFLVVRR